MTTRPDPKLVELCLDWAEGSACSNETAKVFAAEIRHLQKVETAAREWTAERVADGHIVGHSVIPSAQRLLDALEDS